MCNLIFISTDSDLDLSAVSSEQFRFRHPSEEDLGKVGSFLRYPKRWYLQCQYGGCSCHFRHLAAGSDFFFGPAEDWLPEDEDDLFATAAVFDVFADLVRRGYRLDVLDTWNAELTVAIEVDVRISEVGRGAFRFWEGCRFEFIP